MLLFLLMNTVVREGPPPGSLGSAINRATAGLRFDFDAWEAGAMTDKLGMWLLQPQRYMSEPQRCDLVEQYMDEIAQIQALEQRIRFIYTDPEVNDPETATTEMVAQWEQLRAEVERQQLLVEAIMEKQVESALAEEGIGYLGQPFPPTGAHFTPLPYLLILSPRQRIEPLAQRSLVPGLYLSQAVEIEDQLDAGFKVSSLVTPIGGLSAWPAMVLEQSDLAWSMEVFAHEWTHHYLLLHPLGWEYDRSGETRTINETTASIVGKEIGRVVMARYYADWEPIPLPAMPDQPTSPTEEPPFDFYHEMHLTRVEVDRLLDEGQVQEAEQYMEERRQFFVEHGYHIRKLNQAYFAFHGKYADSPTSISPIGTELRKLRDQSTSLRDFLNKAAAITSRQQLLEMLK